MRQVSQLRYLIFVKSWMVIQHSHLKSDHKPFGQKWQKTALYFSLQAIHFHDSRHKLKEFDSIKMFVSSLVDILAQFHK